MTTIRFTVGGGGEAIRLLVQGLTTLKHPATGEFPVSVSIEPRIYGADVELVYRDPEPTIPELIEKWTSSGFARAEHEALRKAIAEFNPTGRSYIYGDSRLVVTGGNVDGYICIH